LGGEALETDVGIDAAIVSNSPEAWALLSILAIFAIGFPLEVVGVGLATVEGEDDAPGRGRMGGGGIDAVEVGDRIGGVLGRSGESRLACCFLSADKTPRIPASLGFSSCMACRASCIPFLSPIDLLRQNEAIFLTSFLGCCEGRACSLDASRAAELSTATFDR
jgi:hypothetical protein